MEEKISFATYLMIVIIIFLVLLVGILGGMLIQKNKDEKILEKDHKNVTTQVQDFKKEDSVKTVENKTEENVKDTKKEEGSKIVLEGKYAIKNSDVFWEFKKDGSVQYSTNLVVREGTYSINNNKEIIIKYSKEIVWNEESDWSKTTKKISKQDKLTYVDSNTLNWKSDGKTYKIVK